MNRLWIGVVILFLLPALGVGMLRGSAVFFGECSRDLEEAGDLAMAGNWSAAGAKVAQSRTRWERYQRFWAAFTDHEPIEQMQTLFSQLEVYEACRLEAEFATACRSLVNLSEAIDESHSLRWWSIL